MHIRAVERSGLGTLSEGQRISYKVIEERGKQSASELKNA
jgi:cold shock CspA family protein